ncbi:MAG: phosphatidylserine decarboxylase [Pseudomonadota bacterium]|nr:phosphatidylserine decarboxylase [Pseudomonadota bacterium]
MSIIPPIKIRPEGRLFITIFFVIAIILFNIAQFLGWIGVILVGWCIYFFRDPDRVTPKEPNLIISPADGVIQLVTNSTPPAELEMGHTQMRRISIFMSVFDCHVNRSPIEGEVIKTAYKPGKFLNASLDKSSEDNERQSLNLQNQDGVNIAVVQIAGLIARRIICWTKEGRQLRAGERFGMIRFGSRVDIYLPIKTRILAIPGQRTIGGETPIAQLKTRQKDRKGEWR